MIEMSGIRTRNVLIHRGWAGGGGGENSETHPPGFRDFFGPKR